MIKNYNKEGKEINISGYSLKREKEEAVYELLERWEYEKQNSFPDYVPLCARNDFLS